MTGVHSDIMGGPYALYPLLMPDAEQRHQCLSWSLTVDLPGLLQADIAPRAARLPSQARLFIAAGTRPS